MHHTSPRAPRIRRTAALCLALLAPAAWAELKVGVILSVTGPAASLGIPAENTIRLWPTEIGGEKVRLTFINDASDPTEASKAAARLVDEHQVDVIVGPSLTPNSVAAMEVAGRNGTPIIALGGGGVIIEPQEGPRKWAFKMPAPEALSVRTVLDHIERSQLKRVAAITVTTSYGEGFLQTLRSQAATRGIEIVASEHYNAADLSTTSQVLKVMAAKPDAVYILSFGTPAALPHMELVKRGYKGPIYQTHGVANAQFVKLGGQEVEGGLLAVAPVLVAEQLPAEHPTRREGMEYVSRYEGRHGEGTRSLFGSTAWTALRWLENTVPEALKAAHPGTPEFRSALRDALEGMKEVVTPEGVFSMSPGNHNGIDEHAQVLVQIENGRWKLVP
ncbi:ABC transporter substrate-binding protein [Thauera chlorobenzoica]|uniref:Branched chain amino acid-binding protein n=1 Tax=Thauera chlorobenzoica TaxID=96773 RepID=A0A1H5YVT7_9RHOO|nr:ABC transporter substrate-binding protein [Thauera chlorobenzoica]APR05853.1 branched chain amino acid-binding protein [Thauera chlorobenzoica]SEG28409.1 amino acid/amide ABC transporter substrate-binding protein, HAAT family [Thauera chlorobenzoica]